MLLRNRVDVTSFEDLRTVDGVVYEIHKSACKALNLIIDEEEYIFVIEELRQQAFPKLFR